MFSRVFSSVAPSVRHAVAILDEPLSATAHRRAGHTHYRPVTNYHSIHLTKPTILRPVEQELESEEHFKPAVELSENDGSYFIEVELPGVRKKDINLEFIDETTMVVHGTIERRGRILDSFLGIREIDGPQPKELVHAHPGLPSLTEVDKCKYSRFQRSFVFPVKVEIEDVRAVYEDGVLFIHVPKVDLHKPLAKKISIECASTK
ncbi:HSP20-like chaperone [Basidiobolus meristosporus CBS 931.73]|uniref:HSP20-like chaperone n=1 Tax=Basidiobolus meristosporus CBS 931.73 TaxID=1314790 RepID=A0A1Y1YZK2_9FUNG|nr:HSP20-like chaperone [Basidiobolus meristosporus CBS 931.73]|eukprot:ORY03389.1 HSP20-like chaperone [Basidiobolus meristosporus CBS 931.73]